MTEIYLSPGEYFFGQHARVRTLLGSCVSTVFWNQRARVGGMTHFVLPSRGKDYSGKFDARYGDESLYIIFDHIKQTETRLKDYRVRLYGGGDMFPGIEQSGIMKIGRSNIVMAKAMLGQYGFVIDEEDIAGNYHRRINLNLSNGSVSVQREAVSG